MFRKIFKVVVLKRARKSITSWIGAAVATTGTAAAIDPAILEMIPEALRGYVIAIVGVSVVIARHRREIADLYARLKADINAALEDAEA